MGVSAEVLDRCNVTATPMGFVVANPGTNTSVDSSATVTVECTQFTFFVVSMDDGQHANGSQRRMKSNLGNVFLNYEIYTNAARTSRWGQGLGAGRWGLTFGAGTINYTAYGRIPSVGAFNPAGLYSDTVAVTVAF